MHNQQQKTALIIGAGPAGLTTSYELLSRTEIVPVIIEKSNVVGGISKTVNYKGNRIDIGGHRFFSKSKRVMQWWELFLPTELSDENPNGPDASTTDKVMLRRNRLSRIYYLRKFFTYPISLSYQTIKNLGVIRLGKILSSYMAIKFSKKKPEDNLEQFFINRFGKVLYQTFFRDYTEKVWGKPCTEIKAEWGAQRIKGLSVSRTLIHALKKVFLVRKPDIQQTSTETSLIDRFLYPKLGPGQLWEEVAEKVLNLGGTINFNENIVGIEWKTSENVIVTTKNLVSQETKVYEANYLFSTMPVKELIAALHNPIPDHIRKISEQLQYRDFITVGLLIRKSSIENRYGNTLKDNWIYIQEKDVYLGRLQIFNNWSPHLVADTENIWLGLEYFCNQGDFLWSMQDDELIRFATSELNKIKVIGNVSISDATVLRVEKAYPAYFGSYSSFNQVQSFLDKNYYNMFLIGRNGMHKYNNQDHSMLTAMVAVDNIINGINTKENIWAVNTETDYHESPEND
jgi:protoporphyrinogen oxidase